MARFICFALVAVGLLLAGYAGYRIADRTEAVPVGALLRSPSSGPQPSVSDPVALVAQERAARLRLEAEVDQLRARLDSLENAFSDPAAQAGVRRDSAADRTRSGSSAQSLEVGVREGLDEAPRASERHFFDEAALLEAGFREDEAAELRRRREDIQMASLSLYDRASREGWLGTERFEEEAATLSLRVREVREELDEEAYDWFLYASQLSNRVRVTGVFDNSRAAEAGLQTGDVLVLYDGQQVFDGAHLIRQTASGRAGELVRLEIERGGERRSFYVPRGALGVRTEPLTRKPPPLH